MRVSAIGITPARKLNFKSKVQYERSQRPLPKEVLDFVDKFEDNCPKGEDGERGKLNQFTDKNFSINGKSAGGESGYVYFVDSKKWNIPNFAIKELKPLKYKKRFEHEYGSLSHEYDMAKKAHDIQSEHIQNPLAYVKTQDGSMFLLSEKMDNIEDFGYSTRRIMTKLNGREIEPKYLKTALDTLAKFDNYKLFHPDLTRSNVEIGKEDSVANFLDFQWSSEIYGQSPEEVQTFVFEPHENANNMTPFEANVIADYLIGMCGNNMMKDYKNGEADGQISEEKKAERISKARQALKEYLQIRADYVPRTSEFDINIFKYPSDDILDAELLRLAILRNHRLQFLYTDDNIEKPRNMMKLVGYSAMANYAAKQLANFEPKNPPRSKEEEEYFDYMRKYGEFWHNKTKNWYPATVNFVRRVAAGLEKAPGRFYKDLFKAAGLDSNNSHFNMLDRESNAFNNWDEDVYNLKENTHQLESRLEKINRGKSVPQDEFMQYVNALYD